MSQNTAMNTLTDKTASALRRMLEAGELGEPLPPERQLARLFDISRITLRRALALLEDQGIIRREQGRGTYADFGVPLVSIESLACEPEPVLAVLVQQKGTHFNPQRTPWTWRICRELSPRLAKRQIPLRLVHDERFMTAVMREELTHQQISGFIAPTHLWDSDSYEAARSLTLPWVGLGRTSLGMFWNIFDPNWTDGLAEAIDDLSVTPDDRVFIPVVAYPREIDQQRWLETALTALDHYGVGPQNIVVQGEGSYESHGYLAMRRYLREHDRPTLILGAFDLTLVGAYRALQNHSEKGIAGIRCLGAADLGIGQYMTPRLSTLSLDYAQIAQKVLAMLEAQRQTDQPVALQEQSARYVRRESASQTQQPLLEISL